MDTSKTDNRRPVVLSLASGYGMLDLALGHLFPLLRVAAYSERESEAVASLVQNAEDGLIHPAPVWPDVVTFPAEGFRGKIDLLVAGYPCQPFSICGDKQGHEDERNLWDAIRAHVETIRPAVVVFENVRNHLNLGYELIRGQLQGLGYRVEQGLFSADEVDQTHERARLFIVGTLLDAAPEWASHLIGPGCACVKHDAMANAHGLRREHQDGSADEGRESSETWSPVIQPEHRETEIHGSLHLRENELANRDGECPYGTGSVWERWRAKLANSRGVMGQGVQQYSWEPFREIRKGYDGPVESWQDFDGGGCLFAGSATQSRLVRRLNGGAPRFHGAAPVAGAKRGASLRTDRIRGDGNGVVFQTAALAIVVLLNRIFQNG